MCGHKIKDNQAFYRDSSSFVYFLLFNLILDTLCVIQFTTALFTITLILYKR